MTITATRSAPHRETRSRSGGRIHLRALVGPFGAIATILFANVLFGGVQPMASLFFSGCLILSAAVSVMLAGPRHATVGMSLAPCLVLAFAFLGLFGSLRTAAPDIAVLLAMCAAWTIGFLAARHRATINILWTTLVWAMLLYTIWVFFTQIGATLGATTGEPLTAGLGSPIEAAVMFGFFALIGSARVMNVIKLMDAEALSRSEMVERLLRDGLGGMLLVGFALTCLAMTGSRVGGLLAISAIVFHSWWDLGFILRREHRSAWLQILEKLTPVASLGAVALAFFLSFFRDEAVEPGIAGAAANTHLQRLEVYWSAFLEQPLFGHGLDQIDTLKNQTTTLYSYVSLSAYGDAQNVALNWLVETGIAGTAIAALVLLAAYVSVLRVFRHRGASRSLPRLVVMAGALLLFHGVADSSLALPGVIWAFALLLGCACGIVAMHASKSPEQMA